MIRRPLSDTCERGAKMIEAIEQFTVVDLVVAAQAGDRSAMDQLFVQFERQVQAIAVRRLGNWDFPAGPAGRKWRAVTA